MSWPPDGIADGNTLYALTDGHYMKIGQSANARRRLQQVRRHVRDGVPGLIYPEGVDHEALDLLDLAPADYDLEAQALAAARPWRVCGEWFADCDELRQVVAPYFTRMTPSTSGRGVVRPCPLPARRAAIAADTCAPAATP